MSQNSCCVPGCPVTRKDDVMLHRFPNPETNTERFNTWISNIGGEITKLDAKIVFGNRRVCHKHFEEIHKYPNNRLCKLAVPVLHIIPDREVHLCESAATAHVSVPIFADFQMDKEHSSKSMVFSSELLNVDDRITKPGLSSTSMQMTERPKKRPREVHVVKKEKETGQKRSKTIKSKAPQVSSAQHKMYKILLKQLQKCEASKKNLKRKYMLARKMTKTEAFKIVSKHMTKTAKIFCQMQVFQSGKKKRGRRFSLDEKIMALSLYKPSPKAYRLLSKICVLPSRRTLQSLLHKIDLKPGVNEFLFEHLRQKVEKMPEAHKYCSLIFDEMAIAPGVSYDKKNDQIKGLVDNGATIKNEYSDHVLVFMIRGVVKKYKQPVAYYFCSGSTKAIDLKAQIKEVITALQKTGLKVVTTVCDQGASNVAAINLLLKETKEQYLRTNKTYRDGFFKIGNEKVFPLYDPPHLIKGIRNNLLTKNLKYVMNGKECTAKWDHIVALYKRCPGYRGVKLVPKLSSQHVFPEQIPKMRVKHCTQVFSKSVGVALGCMAELGALQQESTETADLLMFFDDLFDSVNGSYSQIKNGKVYRSAVTPTSPHNKLWDYSSKILKSMKFVGVKGQGVVPSLSSWIKTLENVKRVVKYLSTKGINSLLLRNFNQDPIENFFGAIRAHGQSNIMPTASAFEAAYKTLLINNITSSHSVGSNCEKDDSVCLQSLKFLLTKHRDNPSTDREGEVTCGRINMEGLNTKNSPSECTSTNCEEEIDCGQNINMEGLNTEINPSECLIEIDSEHLNMEILNTDNMLCSKSPMDVERCAAIGYCSGWIAHIAKKTIYKNCAVCQNDLESDELHSFHQYIKSKEYDNKKWLCYPTRALFDFFAQVENICIQILKTHSNKKKLLNYIQLILTINLNTSFLSCDLHKDILGKYLINKSTTFFLNNWCKEVSGILTGKSPLWDSSDSMKEKAYRHYSKNKGRKRKRQD